MSRNELHMFRSKYLKNQASYKKLWQALLVISKVQMSKEYFLLSLTFKERESICVCTESLENFNLQKPRLRGWENLGRDS